MARTKAGIKHTMLTQDFQIEHWKGWDSPEEQQAINNADIVAIGKIILERLLKKGINVLNSYITTHDCDTQQGWDDALQAPIVEYKTHHLHNVLILDKAVMLEEIAEAVGLEPQFVERPKAGRYSCDNMLAYLIHIKNPDKYQYSPDKVQTLIGEPYMGVYTRRKEAWEKGRAKKQAKEARLDIDWLEDKILSGEVKRPQVLLTDEYFAIYSKNKRRCEDAFDTYAERKVYKTIQAMEMGEFKTSVFFVTGKPGSGKSHFTDALAKKLQMQAKEHGEDWEVCSVAASNPFDEYRGEEVLIMDDLRGMSLSASDWLKLLDPDRINTASARYRNKKMACRAIIINSEKDILEFFYFLKGMGSTGAKEAMDQFLRRILARVVVYRYDDERRVLIGDRQETEPYNRYFYGDTGSICTKDSMGSVPITVSYSFTDVLYDMNYEDALDSLALCVAVQHGWTTKEIREQHDVHAGLIGELTKQGYTIDEREEKAE